MTKAKQILQLAAAGCALALAVWAVVTAARRGPASALSMGPAGGLPVIILDPGHGGVDGGAVGVDKIIEKELNLAISLALRDLLETNGFTVVMTRVDDISIHDDGVTGTKRQKTSDLHNRMAIIEANPGCIFISIHQNKFERPGAWGTQVFYGPNHPDSKLLAEIMQANAAGMLQPGNERAVKAGGKNLYLIHEAKCTAVLLECGFLSNRAEAGRLTTRAYQEQLAFTALCSLLEFLQAAA